MVQGSPGGSWRRVGWGQEHIRSFRSVGVRNTVRTNREDVVMCHGEKTQHGLEHGTHFNSSSYCDKILKIKLTVPEL